MSIYLELVIHNPCSLPLVASLPPCAMNGAAAHITLSHLVNEQASGFEMLLESSDASVALVAQLTATWMAVGDLVPLVKHSHLQHRAELHALLEALADDAKDAARYLQQLSARISSGTDRITAVLGHTSRVLLGAPPPSMTSLQCTIFDIVIPIRSNTCVARPLDPQIVLGVYQLALSTTEDVLWGLMMAAQATLSKLDSLDSRLQSIADIAFWETAIIEQDKEQVLRELWTFLGGNQQRLHQFQRDGDILRDVEAYRKAAAAYVGMVLNTVETMQTTAKETRRMASGVLLRGVLPDELILNITSDGARRLRVGNVQVPVRNLVA
ncbi:hypothetical protein FOMPIDRAFT_1045561 [Fomitopsis schrenkii]|uniref:Uncharacterized protein n=1 Tax=Fomitopsis schrenkii TaxID=2126942 RepID=S8EIA3_FOMSC|nr:hypothetical protein FOMPIDRAFT_1045560 [Fomitopsis schrenkii]EPT04888.1 hypothetical protein FOMPIDRAFT_1045561 [Fomitopsis schrenkii]